ncbi:hypothetical protein XYCOK13_24180 [Xylanibacillus composti]|uniref:Uncharacterized protein n=1 Tax=Xylanibacillus composti TaxID=1572762 RepID=A0A8J4H685_9BACL|nr:hypothetical protein XYCOK13_24180 [Xylanibacillus composti]
MVGGASTACGKLSGTCVNRNRGIIGHTKPSSSRKEVQVQRWEHRHEPFLLYWKANVKIILIKTCN